MTANSEPLDHVFCAIQSSDLETIMKDGVGDPDGFFEVFHNTEAAVWAAHKFGDVEITVLRIDLTAEGASEALVEAVPGLCSYNVGMVDPSRIEVVESPSLTMGR